MWLGWGGGVTGKGVLTQRKTVSESVEIKPPSSHVMLIFNEFTKIPKTTYFILVILDQPEIPSKNRHAIWQS